VSELCPPNDVRHNLEGRVGFESTTPGSKVRDPSAESATQAPSAGIRARVQIDEASPDDLPEKQELYQLATSARRCPGLSIRVPSKGEDDPGPCSRAHPRILVKHEPRHPDPAMEKGSLDCSAIAPQRTMGDYQAAE